MSKAVYTNNKKIKNKVFLSITNNLNYEPYETICFSSLYSLNNKDNLEYFKNFTNADSFSINGFHSWCHKIKENIFFIDNDQDELGPDVFNIIDRKTKNMSNFLINTGGWSYNDYFEKAHKNKKKYFNNKLDIKDKLVFFTLPDMQDKRCKTKFTKKNLTDFSSDFNNFIKNRRKENKFLEFNNPGIYNIYSFPASDFTGDDDVSGHLIELT